MCQSEKMKPTKYYIFNRYGGDVIVIVIADMIRIWYLMQCQKIMNPILSSSDVDPHWLYAEPDLDPQYLMNADPDPGHLNHQIEFILSFENREKKSFLILYPNIRD